MRFSIQLALRHGLVVFLLVGFGILCLGRLEHMAEQAAQLLGREYKFAEVFSTFERALLEGELARQSRDLTRLDEVHEKYLDGIARLARAAIEGEGHNAHSAITDLQFTGSLYFSGKISFADARQRVKNAIAVVERSSLMQASARLKEISRGNTGLVLILGGLAVVVSLSFGFWLSGNLQQPLQQMARVLQAILDGNLNRRFSETNRSEVLAGLTSRLNQVADRLQRAELKKPGDLDVCQAALRKILSPGDAAVCVCDTNQRVLAASDQLSRRLQKEGLPIGDFLSEVESQQDGEVKTEPIYDDNDTKLGEIVTVSMREKA